jgi:hypothetical protein
MTLAVPPKRDRQRLACVPRRSRIAGPPANSVAVCWRAFTRCTCAAARMANNCARISLAKPADLRLSPLPAGLEAGTPALAAFAPGRRALPPTASQRAVSCRLSTPACGLRLRSLLPASRKQNSRAVSRGDICCPPWRTAASLRRRRCLVAGHGRCHHRCGLPRCRLLLHNRSCTASAAAPFPERFALRFRWVRAMRLSPPDVSHIAFALQLALRARYFTNRATRANRGRDCGSFHHRSPRLLDRSGACGRLAG